MSVRYKISHCFLESVYSLSVPQGNLWPHSKEGSLRPSKWKDKTCANIQYIRALNGTQPGEKWNNFFFIYIYEEEKQWSVTEIDNYGCNQSDSEDCLKMLLCKLNPKYYLSMFEVNSCNLCLFLCCFFLRLNMSLIDACLPALYIKQRLGFLNGAKLRNVIKEGWKELPVLTGSRKSASLCYIYLWINL